MNKILFVVSNHVHLARQKLLLEALGSHVTVKEVKMSQGDYGDTLPLMHEVAGHLFLTACRLIPQHDPDIVLIRGDRFEVLQVAAAATYLKKIIAHIEGGDVSGAMDEHIRHAITKLAHLHFPTNEEAKQRIMRMGEDPGRVFNFGSLDCEFALQVPKVRLIEEPYILVLHHEIPGEEGAYQGIIEAVKKTGLKHVSVRSNNDYIDVHGTNSFSPENFIRLLWGAECLVGNSSSGIKEAAALGTPVVNVGDRQKGRLREINVLDYPDRHGKDLDALIRKQVGMGRYPQSMVYYRPDTAKNIAKVLLEANIPFQKRYVEPED